LAGIKGQAAITDALFFLVIVMGLVSFLFFFTSQYGRTVGEYATSKYGSDYATSALKTVLYSSFSRNEFPLDSPEAEVDFLVAAIKEDYADDENINYFKDDLTSSISSVMKPVNNSFDYFFFIRVDSGQTFKFPYFYLSRKEFTSVYDSSGVFVESVETQDKNYFCVVDDQTKIDSFIVFVGAQGQAVSPISFPLISGVNPHEGIVGLVLWVPRHFEDTEEVFAALNCTEITEET
jgi:hypothetical protein